MTRTERIRSLLVKTFSPKNLEVINNSHEHAGHQGSPGTGESHYTIVIKAQVFDGLSQVQSHQAIYQALDSEFKSGLHALSIKVL